MEATDIVERELSLPLLPTEEPSVAISTRDLSSNPHYQNMIRVVMDRDFVTVSVQPSSPHRKQKQNHREQPKKVHKDDIRATAHLTPGRADKPPRVEC